MKSPDMSQLNIIMVEDDDDHAELSMRAMRKSGVPHTVKRFRDGHEAIEFLSTDEKFENGKPANLVLLDLKLPKIDGFGVLESIRRHEKFKTTPVIVLSTSSVEKDIDRAYKLGANSYLRKPVQLEDFLKMVKDLSTYWGEWNHQPTV